MDTIIRDGCRPFQAHVRLTAIAGLDVKPTFKKTLLVLDSFCNSKTGRLFPCVKTIAKRRGLCERSVQYHLRKLEGLGLLERHERHAENGRQRSNTFTPSYVQLAHPYAGGVADTGQRQKLHPPLDVSCTPLTKGFEPKKEQDSPAGFLFHFEKKLTNRLLDDLWNTERHRRGSLILHYRRLAVHSLSHQHAVEAFTKKDARPRPRLAQ